MHRSTTAPRRGLYSIRTWTDHGADCAEMALPAKESTTRHCSGNDVMFLSIAKHRGCRTAGSVGARMRF